jgi:hypothetical protein
LVEAALKVVGVPESQLIPVMEDLGRRFPLHKLFSLPHMGDSPHVLLGARGRGGLDELMEALRETLRRAGMTFEEDSR